MSHWQEISRSCFSWVVNDRYGAWVLATMKLEEWHKAGRVSKHRGYELFYRDEGQGEALVCVHGFPTASWDWVHVWPELIKRYCVIAPDMLGFGFSAKPLRHNYSINEQADIHEGLLAELGLTRVHILAHDYGDTVTQELLARHLERNGSGLEIGSVCLLNGGLFPESHRARRIQSLMASPLGPLLSRLTTERMFRQSFSAIFGPDTPPTEEELKGAWKLVRHNRGDRITHKLLRYLEERRENRERWVGALQKTRVPLRLVNGTHDPVSGRHMAERYREIVPNPDVVLLERIGHYPQLEAAAEVVAAYSEFRDRLI